MSMSSDHSAPPIAPPSKRDASLDLTQYTHVDLVRELLRRRVDLSALLDSDSTWIVELCRALPLQSAELTQLGRDFPTLARELHHLNMDQPLLKVARRASRADAIKEMITAYLNHIARQPEDHETRLVLGRILIDRGELSAARQLMRRGALREESPFTLALEAEVLFAHQEYTRAHHVAKRAYTQGSVAPHVIITYALCCGWVGEDQAEEEALQEAYNLAPEDQLVCARFWGCTRLHQEPLKTLSNIERAYEREPSRVLHLALINATLSACQFTRALEESQTLVQRHPKSISAQLTLASALFHQAKLEESLQICEALFERDVDTPALHFIWVMGALALNETMLVSTNLSELRRATLVQEGRIERLCAWGDRSPRVAMWYAQVLEVLDREPEAHVRYSAIFENYPSSSVVQIAYIKSALNQGLFEESAALITRILSCDPERLEAILLSAELKFQRGDERAALIDLERCAELPNARELKLRILIKRGLYPEASALALALYHEAPSQSAYLEYVVNSIWQDDRLELAEVKEHLLELFGLAPTEAQPPTLLTLFGYLFLHLDESDLARELLELIYKHERHSARPLKLFRRQRLKFICELAYQLRHQEALARWSTIAVERYPEAGELLFYRAITRWHQGACDEAFEMSMNAFEMMQEGDIGAEELLITSIWACELGYYKQAAMLLNHLAALPNPPSEDVRALSIRIQLNLRTPEAFSEGYEAAESWLIDQVSADVLESFIDWCLESIMRRSDTRNRGQTLIHSAYDADDLDALLRDEMSLDEMSLDEMSLDEMSLDEMSLDEMSLDEMNLSEVSRDEVSRDEVSRDEVSRDEVSLESDAASSEVVSDQELIKCAQRWAESATRLYPEEPELWRRLSFILNLQDQLDLAISAQTEVVMLAGVTSFDWLSLAHLYEANLQLNQAHHAFNQMVHLVREAHDQTGLHENAQLLLERACFLLRCQAAERAHEAFKELLTWVNEAPEVEGEEPLSSSIRADSLQVNDAGPLYVHEVVFVWLAHAFEHLSPAEASTLARTLYQRYSYPFVAGFYGLALVYADESESALPLLKRGYEHDLYFGIEYACALWSTGRRRSALDVLFDCIAQRSDDLECRHTLLTMLIEVGDGEGAEEQLLRLIHAAPHDPRLKELRTQVYALLEVH